MHRERAPPGAERRGAGIGLSIDDAEWLFDWSPPAMPLGWHTRYPAAQEETLWVVVEATTFVLIARPTEALPAPTQPGG